MLAKVDIDVNVGDQVVVVWAQAEALPVGPLRPVEHHLAQHQVGAHSFGCRRCLIKF